MVTSKQIKVGRGDRIRRKSKIGKLWTYQTAQFVHGDGRGKKTKTREVVATAQVMLALTKGVVYMGVVLSVKTILKSWQLCLSFKLDVLTT